MVSSDHQLDTIQTHLGRVSRRAYICWVGLWAYLWEEVLIKLTDRRALADWAVPFPGLEAWKGRKLKLGTSKWAREGVGKQACISALVGVTWLDVSSLHRLTFPKIMDWNLELLVQATPFSSKLLFVRVYHHSHRMKLEDYHNGLPETWNTNAG